MTRETWLLVSMLASACAVTDHPSERAQLGTQRSSRELLEALEQPGPVVVETVSSSDWSINRAGLINLEHPRARAAGLEDGDEPIQIYFHALRHPTRGTFIIDTGVERALRDEKERAVLRGLAASALHSDRLRIHAPLGAWLEEKRVTLAGVLLTHVHADHLLGLPDVPRSVPIYVGPGETSERALRNLFVQPLLNDLLAGHPPLRELSFAADRAGRFQGVLDLFGDGSLWALHTPGHTPGSVAYVARTPEGSVLFTGDTCHTAWGWQNDVEPGTFSSERAANAKSLRALRDLAREYPSMRVRLGHQPLAQD